MSLRVPVRGWVRRHLTRGEALSWPLLAGVGLVLVGGWTFGAVAEGVLEHDDLAGQDGDVTAWLAGHRTAGLTAAMRIATRLGGFWFTVPLVVAVGLALPARWGRLRSVAFMVTVTGGTALLINAVKLLVARPRPTLADVIATANGYSFPSGHSGQAVAAYGAVAYLVVQRLRHPAGRAAVWLGAVLIALLVGFSRVYLGVHWLTDVLGGYLVAVVWLASVITAATALTLAGAAPVVDAVRVRGAPDDPVPRERV